ncbi:hypothetical protein [Haladaptatus sp. NG-SE-30]
MTKQIRTRRGDERARVPGNAPPERRRLTSRIEASEYEMDTTAVRRITHYWRYSGFTVIGRFSGWWTSESDWACRRETRRPSAVPTKSPSG